MITYIKNAILHCIYVLQVRNNQYPVLITNGCFIEDPSFSTSLGVDGVNKILILTK